MIILTLAEVIRLKEEVKKYAAVNIHFHDGCGGQYFTIDKADDAVIQFITKYFCDKKMRAVFSEDRLQFTIEKA